MLGGGGEENFCGRGGGGTGVKGGLNSTMGGDTSKTSGRFGPGKSGGGAEANEEGVVALE